MAGLQGAKMQDAPWVPHWAMDSGLMSLQIASRSVGWRGSRFSDARVVTKQPGFCVMDNDTLELLGEFRDEVEFVASILEVQGSLVKRIDVIIDNSAALLLRSGFLNSTLTKGNMRRHCTIFLPGTKALTSSSR